MGKELVIILSDLELSFYESIGADPKVVLEYLNRQVIEIVKNATTIYDGFTQLDEQKMAGLIIQSGLELTEERKKTFKKNSEQEKEKKKKLKETLKKKNEDCPKLKNKIKEMEEN